MHPVASFNNTLTLFFSLLTAALSVCVCVGLDLAFNPLGKQKQVRFFGAGKKIILELDGMRSDNNFFFFRLMTGAAGRRSDALPYQISFTPMTVCVCVCVVKD